MIEFQKNEEKINGIHHNGLHRIYLKQKSSESNLWNLDREWKVEKYDKKIK